eukprot:c667_g1_i1.p1 GENE.c667_g1_i1~~c667_g1_i1.p1  ORF type:complete len:380 (-),score=79.83 c667_g1_i1:343-1482(-)
MAQFQQTLQYIVVVLLSIFVGSRAENVIEGGHPYSNNANIHTQLVCPAGSTVKITIVAMELECHFDSVSLLESDGEELFKSRTNFCNLDSGKVLYSATSNVTFAFTSDHSVTKRGYKLTWECKACGFFNYVSTTRSQSCRNGATQDCVNLQYLDKRGTSVISLRYAMKGSQFQLSGFASNQTNTPYNWTLINDWTLSSGADFGPLCTSCIDQSLDNSNAGCLLATDGNITDSLGATVLCHMHTNVQNVCNVAAKCKDCLRPIAMVAIVFFFCFGLCMCVSICLWACNRGKKSPKYFNDADDRGDVEMRTPTKKATASTRSTIQPISKATAVSTQAQKQSAQADGDFPFFSATSGPDALMSDLSPSTRGPHISPAKRERL